MEISKQYLENIYTLYNKKEYVHPDPLEFLYNYNKLQERELVGLLASGLAYGNVKVILKSIKKTLDAIGEIRSVFSDDIKELRYKLGHIKHRFTAGEEIATILVGTRRIINEYGGLGIFLKRIHKNNIIETQQIFVNEILRAGGLKKSTMLPNPMKGSASKRLNLYFRWMVRKDEVDPGGWELPRKDLLIPLDTHMHSFCKKHGITTRNSGDLKTVLEITEFFKRLCPKDPVKYDFVITRPGISGLVFDI